VFKDEEISSFTASACPDEHRRLRRSCLKRRRIYTRPNNAIATARSTVAQRRSEQTALEAVGGTTDLPSATKPATPAPPGAAVLERSGVGEDRDDARTVSSSADRVGRLDRKRPWRRAAPPAITTAGSLVIEADRRWRPPPARDQEHPQRTSTASQLQGPPEMGRVQYRVAQPGEGTETREGRWNMIDLSTFR